MSTWQTEIKPAAEKIYADLVKEHGPPRAGHLINALYRMAQHGRWAHEMSTWRVGKSLSVERAAQMLGIKPDEVTAIESQTLNPTPADMRRIRQALKIIRFELNPNEEQE